MDLEAEESRLPRVQVSGSFFLEPESAPDAISTALEDFPAGSEEATLAHAVRRALP